MQNRDNWRHKATLAINGMTHRVGANCMAALRKRTKSLSITVLEDATYPVTSAPGLLPQMLRYDTEGFGQATWDFSSQPDEPAGANFANMAQYAHSLRIVV